MSPATGSKHSASSFAGLLTRVLVLHIACPHCDAVNRAPRSKLDAGVRGKCGKCGKPLFEGRPLSLDADRFERHVRSWGLDQKKTLIEKAYAALPSGGALVAYDTVIDDARRHNVFGLLMSLNMLIETPGGADYTAADCAEWMRDAGFATTRSEHLVGPESMVIGIK